MSHHNHLSPKGHLKTKFSQNNQEYEDTVRTSTHQASQKQLIKADNFLEPSKSIQNSEILKIPLSPSLQNHQQIQNPNDYFIKGQKQFAHINDSVPEWSEDYCTIDIIARCISSETESIYKQRAQSYYSEFSSVYFSTSIYQLISEETTNLLTNVKKSNNFEYFFPDFMNSFSFIHSVHRQIALLYIEPANQFLRFYPGSDGSLFINNIIEELNDYNSGSSNNIISKTQKGVTIFQQDNYLQLTQNLKGKNDDNIGIVSFELPYSIIQDMMKKVLYGNETQVFLMQEDGNILAKINTNFTKSKNFYSQIPSCICNSIVEAINNYTNIDAETVCTTQNDKNYNDNSICDYFAINQVFNYESRPLYLVQIDLHGKNKLDNDISSIVTILWIYCIFFFISLFQACFTTGIRVNTFTRDITNPIKQIAYKMHGIMKNIFNAKVFSNISPDDIVIKEDTEIRNLANNFSKMYRKQVNLGLFSSDLIAKLESSTINKNKEFQKKPSNDDKFIEEVEEIMHKFLSENLNELELKVNYFRAFSYSQASPSVSRYSKEKY
ncbi:hypothetical protein PPERSA_10797 [Pseudocohnilembus persalinus]|uniref:Uncharacterized protein n=1 Tax=Pseudocohnilembus persalinus TaxID=266149 RepID=A0A0V0QDM2_PSEPJ|nr:hypothetical protein PPERSA_10797 [Pseudocohnilembus persalinus]|eukprot:KRX00298.1 hypothetical protein PPERSA_10797 [Pseudocohnilembus persalinus]